MSFRVRFTEEAQSDIDRRYGHLLEQCDGDWTQAERALEAIRRGITLLESSPFSCRKPVASNSFLRELIISSGASGYVALFEIDSADTVTVLALRHQREDDYH